jgi:hypothetical protein
VILGLAALTGGAIWITSRKPTTTPSVADAGAPVPSSVRSTSDTPVAAEVDAASEASDGAVLAEAKDASTEDPRCSPIFSANEAAYRRAEALAGDACMVHPEPLRDALEECEGNAKGVWALVVDDAEIGHAKAPPGACDAVRFQVALVHVDAAGKTTRAVPLATPGKPEKNLAVEVWGARTIAPLATFDFDGDGELEVLVMGNTDHEGVHIPASEIWTFKDGRIQPYAKGAGIVFTEVVDADNDGRLDLVTRGPYEAVRATSCQGPTFPVAPEAFLMRGEPLGVFTLNGATSKARLLAECPGATPGAGMMGGDSEALATAVVCARAWGKTAAETLKMLETTCTSWVAPNKECERPPNACPEWVKKMAAITPPIALP